MIKLIFIIILLIVVFALFSPYLATFFSAFTNSLTTIFDYINDVIFFLADSVNIAFSQPYLMMIISFFAGLWFISFIFNHIFGGKE